MLKTALLAFAFGLAISSKCPAAENRCPPTANYGPDGNLQMISTASQAERLGRLYEKSLDEDEARPGLNWPKYPWWRKLIWWSDPEIQTKIKVSKSGDEWRVVTTALIFRSYEAWWSFRRPRELWAPIMEMTICAADGKLAAIKIHQV